MYTHFLAKKESYKLNSKSHRPPDNIEYCHFSWLFSTI